MEKLWYSMIALFWNWSTRIVVAVGFDTTATFEPPSTFAPVGRVSAAVAGGGLSWSAARTARPLRACLTPITERRMRGGFTNVVTRRALENDNFSVRYADRVAISDLLIATS